MIWRGVAARGVVRLGTGWDHDSGGSAWEEEHSLSLTGIWGSQLLPPEDPKTTEFFNVWMSEVC